MRLKKNKNGIPNANGMASPAAHSQTSPTKVPKNTRALVVWPL
jgi:hypothetical protein